MRRQASKASLRKSRAARRRIDGKATVVVCATQPWRRRIVLVAVPKRRIGDLIPTKRVARRVGKS